MWFRRRRLPRVHLYSICWNEAAMLASFFRHYDPWVERYVFFDDGSTDGTISMIRRHPRAELRPFTRAVPDSYVLSAQVLQNAMWQESRGAADWVVVTAVDEHLFHPAGPAYLRACHAAGITLIPALGYQMLAEAPPPPGALLADAVRQGAVFGMMSKLSLFRPDAIEQTGFGLGRHIAHPAGDLRLPRRDEMMLLHFKYMGRARTHARHGLLATGLGAMDRREGWGYQYQFDERLLNHEFDGFAARALDVRGATHLPWRDHGDPRWWRQEGEALDGGALAKGEHHPLAGPTRRASANNLGAALV